MPAGRHLTISGVHIEASKHVRYLGVEIDEHLTFNPQLASLHRKVGAKLSAVYRIRSGSCRTTAALLGGRPAYRTRVWLSSEPSEDSAIGEARYVGLEAMHSNGSTRI